MWHRPASLIDSILGVHEWAVLSTWTNRLGTSTTHTVALQYNSPALLLQAHHDDMQVAAQHGLGASDIGNMHLILATCHVSTVAPNSQTVSKADMTCKEGPPPW